MKAKLPKLRSLLLIIFVFCLAAGDLPASDTFPRIDGERLTGSALILPDGIKGKITLLIISFSRSAQSQTAQWGKRVSQRKAEAGAFDYLQLLELEDVPKFFRGFIKSSLKKSVPKDDQVRFILIYQSTDSLKALTAFKNNEEAYLLLVDEAGVVRWVEHGAVSDQKFDELQKKVQSITAPSSK